MTCAEFYTKTKSIINPTGLNITPNGSVNNVYFGSAHSVVFHDQWDADNLGSLLVLQDLNSWENSAQYVEAHYFTANDGTTCVSLSATSDPQFNNDVTDVRLIAGNVEVQGFPRLSDGMQQKWGGNLH